MQAFFVLIATNLVMLLSHINSTAISVAFPDITAYYNTSLVLAGWVLSIYQLIAACSMVLMGKVSDVLGRKNTFLICCGLFVTGSVFAALAPSIQLLIAARFVQSVGAGGFTPSLIGIIIEIFPRHRQQAIGASIAIGNFGGIIGPSIGGWLITSFGWQAIFWFNVPVILAAVIPLFFLLKNSKRENVPIDFTGAGYFSAFLFTFMVGLSQVAHSVTSAGWMFTGLLFAVSICFLVLFIRHELKTPYPIIDLALLRLKPFQAANIYNFMYGACLFGFTSLVPLYAVTVYSMTTFESGYVLMARSVSYVIASMASGFLLVKWGYHKPMLLGAILTSIGLILLGFEFSKFNIWGTEISSVVLVSAVSLIIGFGAGIATSSSSNACVELMPERASTMQGIRGMFRQTGGAISIAITTLVLQFIGNMATGFTVVFIATGLLVLLTIPFIFAMPDRDKRIIAKE